jgi:hypothetical protein
VPYLNSNTAAEAQIALEKLGATKEQLTDAYIVALENPSLDISIAAANALADLGDQRCVEFLIETLKKRNVVKSLNRLGIRDPRVDRFNEVVRRVPSSNLIVKAYNIIESGNDFIVIHHPATYEMSNYDWYDPNGFNYGPIPIEVSPSSDSLQIIPKGSQPPAASAAVTTPVGGIDFNSAALDLQIKRDKKGVPLPLPQQTIQNMKIDGFYPVIINIAPVNIPMLLGQKTQKEPQQLSALR